MSFNWRLFRDRIVINAESTDTIAQEIRFRNIPPGSNLFIAAREMSVAAGYQFRLPGYNVVLIADRFDGASGQIDLSGVAGHPGRSGSNGQNGVTSGLNGTAGENGGNGTDGTPGTSGAKLSLYCRQLAGATLNTNGAPGGDGGKGGSGGNGGAGRPPAAGRPEGAGGRGGNAGNGGNGGAGGNGGDVTVVYVEDATPAGFDPGTSIHALQGEGGRGDDAGVPGEGGFGEPDGEAGAAGAPGTNGRAGIPGAVNVMKLALPEYWNQVRTALADLAADWSEFRTRAGDYYFRAWKPGVPELSNYPGFALDNLEAAEILDSDNRRAAWLKGALLNHQNVLGIARDYDLIPDFTKYEAAVTGYGPMIQGLAKGALAMLPSNAIDAQKQAIENAISAMQQKMNDLEMKRIDAEFEVTATKQTHNYFQARIEETRQMMRDREQELSGVKVVFKDPTGHEWTQLEIDTVLKFGQFVIAMVGVIVSVAALPELVKAAWNTIGGKELLDAETRAGGLEKLKKLAGGVNDAVTKSKDFISAAKALEDVDKTTLDDKYKQLLKQLIELVFKNAVAELRVAQASLALDAVNDLIETNKKDIESAQEQLNRISDEITTRTDAARILIRRAQTFMDVLTEYVFFAARCVAIYTLSDVSDGVAYDTGYIHPDDEDDAYEAVARGDDSKIARLLAAYELSWSHLPDTLYYKELYDKANSGDPAHDLSYFSFKDPQTIEQFRTSHELTFRIDLKDLPETRYESKAESAYLSLVGATAVPPVITSVVEHEGAFSERRADGQVVSMDLRPHRATVMAGKSPVQISGGAVGFGPEQLGFWGRGVAAEWRVYIEPDQFTQSQVDLSGLQEIQVFIGYRSILK